MEFQTIESFERCQTILVVVPLLERRFTLRVIDFRIAAAAESTYWWQLGSWIIKLLLSSKHTCISKLNFINNLYNTFYKMHLMFVCFSEKIYLDISILVAFYRDSLQWSDSHHLYTSRIQLYSAFHLSITLPKFNLYLSNKNALPPIFRSYLPH